MNKKFFALVGLIVVFSFVWINTVSAQTFWQRLTALVSGSSQSQPSGGATLYSGCPANQGPSGTAGQTIYCDGPTGQWRAGNSLTNDGTKIRLNDYVKFQLNPNGPNNVPGWVLTSADQFGNAYWGPPTSHWILTSNNDIKNTNSGNVGIGTLSPKTLLHVAGDTNPALMVEDTNAGADAKRFRVYSEGGKAVFDAPNDGFNNARQLMGFNLTTGNVGIGTNNPTQKLEVAGALRLGEVPFDQLPACTANTRGVIIFTKEVVSLGNMLHVCGGEANRFEWRILERWDFP